MADRVDAEAPGRVNLIGEHTDYHEGFVLPTVIPQRTRVHITRRPDRRVVATSRDVADGRGEYQIGRETAGRGWIDYVQGVTMILRREHLDVPGFEVTIESDIPAGAGVSSSAALTVSLLRGLRRLAGFALDDVRLARLAQAVETDFVGAPIGVMDQMVCSLGRPGEALFIDTRSFAVERIPLPSAAELVVIHSGITHAHAGGEYVTRRRESFEAAECLGVERLRDLDPAVLGTERFMGLPPVLGRRARHIVTENQRVLAAVAALRTGDLAALGALFAASHASMRDDYEVSVPDVDRLVALATRQPGIYGARLTGGGFGGAVVMIAAAGRGRRAAGAICDAYVRQSGREAKVLVPPPE